MRDHPNEDWLKPELLDADQGESWMLTYTDTVTLILTLFVVILTFANFENQTAKVEAVETDGEQSVLPQDTSFIPIEQLKLLQARLEKEKQEKIDDMRKQVDALLNEPGVTSRTSDEGVLLDLDSSILFATGSADLATDSAGLLDHAAGIVQKTSFNIVVEGHTDNQPIYGGAFASNWELSSARAIAVLERLRSLGVDQGRMRAVAYAETKPVSTNATEEGRASNRRVSILLLAE